MTRAGALLLVALMLLPVASVEAQARELPGDYPDPVVETFSDLLGSADADAWPEDREVHPNATHVLEAARSHLEEGRLSDALDRYVAFRVLNAVHHIADDAATKNPDQGRSQVSNVTSTFQGAAQAAIRANRGLVNGLDTGELTVRGAETAVWGALLVARAELQLNLLPRVTARDVYVNSTLDTGMLHQRVALTLGALTYANVGGQVASIAPRVQGPQVAPAEMTSRLEQVANQSLSAQGNSQILDFLPRGNATRDNAALRAGLLITSDEQLTHERFRRQYLEASKRGAVAGAIDDVLATDRKELRPWAQAGSPLALAAYEAVSLDIDESKRIGQQELNRILQNRSVARATLSAQALLAPEDSELNESPLPGVVAAMALVSIAALALRRRDRRS